MQIGFMKSECDFEGKKILLEPSVFSKRGVTFVISQESQCFLLAFGCGEANGQEGKVGLCVGVM